MKIILSFQLLQIPTSHFLFYILVKVIYIKKIEPMDQACNNFYFS